MVLVALWGPAATAQAQTRGPFTMPAVRTATPPTIDGVVDVDEWYTERDGKAAINYGASSGHMPARQRVMHDMLPEELQPAHPSLATA